MALIVDLFLQAAQMVLVVAIAPAVLGITRKVKARLLRRIGPPLLQPYLDLWKLMHKEAVLAHNASWVYRVAPYLIFAATWVAAALVPSYATGLLFSGSADLIAIVALIGTARFALALAGMDVGTAFGGIGSSREMMIASLAEPAMLLIVFTVALVAGTTQLSAIATLFATGSVGLRVSLGLGLFAFLFVAIAENARIPIDNPATHLELTMVHEAMVLEYSGRHLAVIEAAAALKLVLYFSLIICLFVPFSIAGPGAGLPAFRESGLIAYLAKVLVLAVLLPIGETSVAEDAGVSLPDLRRQRICGRGARGVPSVRLERLLMSKLLFDVAHLLAGSMLVLSFLLLYQDRITAVINVFAMQAMALALSVAWQALVQDAPHLFVTAALALVVKGFVIPTALHRIVRRLEIHREVEQVIGGGPTILTGLGLVALSILLMQPVGDVNVYTREDLAFALAVILLGLLMMITRRNAVTQVVGFMSLENGLILAATGAKGMPLVVEVSVAFSVLIAFIVFGVFVFRMREPLRLRRRQRPRSFPRRAEGHAVIGAVEALFLVPAIALPVLALVSGYRLGAGLNVLACACTLTAAISLMFTEHPRSDLLIIDDFNIFLIVLTAFVGFTTSVFSATYIAHEIEIGRLTPVFLRFYHAMYQALMCAMNVALVANNIGLMWVGVEVATLSTVMMVGIYRTPEAIEAAWKYFILGSVGIGLAFFGTILVYLVAQDVIGAGLPAMTWDLLVKNAAALDPKLLSLGFVFLLVGYGTKVGLAPFHAWLPDAHAEGPTPISAVLSGLLLNVALYALLRFKMVLAGNPGAIDVGAIMVALGLISLVFAAFMLYRRRDIKRLFAYSSIEHMGIAAFAFGMGGPLANFAGLLHMTMHSLIKSGIFFAVGHIAQVKGTQRIAAISGHLGDHIRCWRCCFRSASSPSRGCRRSACSPASSCWCPRPSPASRP